MRKVLCCVLALVLALASVSAMAISEKLNTPGELPIVNTDVTIVVGTPAVATVTDYDNNAFTNWLREKSGVDIQVYLYDTSEYKTQFQLATSAGEKLQDTLWNFSFNALERESYGSQEYFVDLLPYFEAHELTYYFDGEAASYLNETEKAMCTTAGLSSNGALYAFPFWAVSVPDPWSDGLLINNTFCEALDMPIPSTIDEYYDYLVAVKTKDPNGNGIADEIPLVGFTNSINGDPIVNLINSFTFYPDTGFNDVSLCCDDEGKIYVPYMTEEFKEGLRFVAKLYAEGLISDLSFSQDRYGLQAMTDLTGEDNPDIVGSATSHRSYMFASHATAERRTHYTTIGPLVGPEGVAYAATSAVEPVYKHFITTDCADPEVAFRLLDLMTTTESTLCARYGSQDAYWRWATDEEKAAGNWWEDLGYHGVLYVTGGEGLGLAWGQQTNEIWNITSITWQPQGFTALSPKTLTDNPISNYNAEDWNGGVMLRYGKAPKNLVGTLAYTADELAMKGTIDTDIGTYVRESMTRFVIGELDIDADWDAFQQALQTMGIQTVLDCAQAAWDRAHN